MDVRELVARSLDNPALLARVGDEEDLLAVGVNSGELIRIALSCEDVLGRALTDDELTAVHSLDGVRRLLGEGGHHVA